MQNQTYHTRLAHVRQIQELSTDDNNNLRTVADNDQVVIMMPINEANLNTQEAIHWPAPFEWLQ